MQKKRPWDKYEAAILLNAYLKVIKGEISRKNAVLSVSHQLRRRAIVLGVEIDETFRSEAEILFQMHCMESAYKGYTVLKPANKLFLDISEIWNKNRDEFDRILAEAMNTSDNKSVEEEFLIWLARKVTDKQLSELYILYSQIDDYCINRGILKDHLFNTTDLGILKFVEKTVDDDKDFGQKYKRQIYKMSEAIHFYLLFVSEEIVEKSNSIGIKEIELKKRNTEGISSVGKEDNALQFVDIKKRKQEFIEWMEQNNTNAFAAKTYLSALALAGEIAVAKGVISKNIFEINDPECLQNALSELLIVPEFEEKNEERYNQLVTAWKKYINYSNKTTTIQKKEKPEASRNKRKARINSSLSSKPLVENVDGADASSKKRIDNSEKNARVVRKELLFALELENADNLIRLPVDRKELLYSSDLKKSNNDYNTTHISLEQSDANSSLYCENYIKKYYSAVYYRLRSLSKVFDNQDIVEASWIGSLLEISIDQGELIKILDSLPWIKKIGDGKYSFAQVLEDGKNEKEDLKERTDIGIIQETVDKQKLEKDTCISRKSFDLQESVILLDVYLDMKKNKLSLTEGAQNASNRLRALVKKNGFSYDNSFRSPQGLCNRLRTLSGVFEGTSNDSYPATSAFVEAVALYKYNREKYEEILASEKMPQNKISDHIIEKRQGEQEMSDIQKEIHPYFQWLKNNVSASERLMIKESYNSVNMLLIKTKTLDRALIDIVSIEDIDSAVGQIKKTVVNKNLRITALKVLLTYRNYLQSTAISDNVSKPEINKDDKIEDTALEPDKELLYLVEKSVLETDLEGITLEQLSKKHQGMSISSLKRIRDESEKIICFYEKMVHREALVDLDNAAVKFHEIIEKLLSKNEGYVSSAQLFDYVRMEMQMFLNDNDLFDEQKVFCIVRYLFEKINWHGYHYVFSAGKHISRGGDEALRSNMDVIMKFARERGGVFQWDDLLEYLNRVGIEPNNLRVRMEIGTRPVFFYYSEDGLITVESMNIDENWISQVRDALKRLFDDVGDHIVIREIATFWYGQLPELPCRIQWSPVLLQYVIKFYGDQLGARTIHSEMPQRYDTVHALLVRKDSCIQTFGDAVASYLIDNEIEERHFQAEQLRKLLAYGKLIGNLELIGNVPRAIGKDPRFAWDITGENVNVIL